MSDGSRDVRGGFGHPPRCWRGPVHVQEMARAAFAAWLQEQQEGQGSLIIFLPATIELGQLLEAVAPLVEVVVVLVLVGVRGVEGAERGGLRTAALVVKHQQGVVGGGRGVRVSRLQVLGGDRRGAQRGAGAAPGPPRQGKGLTSSMKFPISSGLAGRGRYWGAAISGGATSLRITSGRASRPRCSWLRS